MKTFLSKVKSVFAVLGAMTLLNLCLFILLSGRYPLKSSSSDVRADNGSSDSGSKLPGDLGATVEIPPLIVVGDEPFEYSFKVTNPFSETVKFTKVTPSCSCASVKLKSDSLEPASSTTLVTSVRLSREKIEPKSVLVTLVDSDDRQWRYRLNLKSYPGIRIEQPPSYVQLGEFQTIDGWDAKLDVFVYRPEKEAPYALESAGNLDGIKAEVSKSEAIRLPYGVVEQKFGLALKGESKNAGNCFANLELFATNNASRLDLKLNLHWTIKGPFELSPSTISFGYSPESTAVERVLKIRRLDGGSFSILGMRSEEDAITLEQRREADNHAAVIVATLNRETLSRPFRKRMIIQTDDPVFSTLTVWMSGLPSREAPVK